MDDTVQMTYEDIAAKLKIEVDSARKLVRRRRWKRTTGNDGKTRIEVPLDYDWDRGREAPADTPEDTAKEPPNENQVHQMLGRLEGELVGIREVVAAERGRAEVERQRADEALHRLAEVQQERDERIAVLKRERDETIAKIERERDQWISRAMTPWWRRRRIAG